MRYLTLLFLLAIGIALPRTAEAGCTDPAHPGVEWTRCLMNERPLVNADLTGANMFASSFSRSDLTGGIFDKIDGRRAKFVSVIAPGARFNDAVLIEADFTKADLRNASFVNADLRDAKLFRADLRGADLTGAQLGGADLWMADLSGARWNDGETICGEGSHGQCK